MSLTSSFAQGNPRTTAILAVAKENKLDIELVLTEPAKGVSTEYLKLNKLGKIPTFEGADGYVLSECIAIAVYCMYPIYFLPYLPTHALYDEKFIIQLSLSEINLLRYSHSDIHDLRISFSLNQLL